MISIFLFMEESPRLKDLG